MTISRNLSDLANQVDSSGTLGVAGGGTGSTSLTGIVKGSGTSALTAGNVNLSTEVTNTLPVTNGGTGQTSFTNGQLLIGNTTGNTLTKTTLTAGVGVNITNGNGSITLSSPATVFLGTVNTTANNSNSLSVNLTDYEALFCVFVGVSCNAASTIVYISSDNSQTYSTGTFTTAATAYSGTLWLDLISGVYTSTVVAPFVSSQSNITTSTTTLYFRCNSTNTFDAGSIRVYGVL